MRVFSKHALSASRANGWTFGNAHFLVDGWRNEFHLNNGNTRSVLVYAYAGGTSEKAPKGFRYFRPFKDEPFMAKLAGDPEFRKALRKAILQPSAPAQER